MLKVRTMDYVHIDDICEMFGLDMRNFSFTEEQENDSYCYLHINSPFYKKVHIYITIFT